MTHLPPPHDTAPLGVHDDALNELLPRRQKVVLVIDLVESVRLMASNEAAVVQHWHGFVRHARAQVLPRHHGRHVKSLGDGILAEFDSAHEAVSAAAELHDYFDELNQGLPADRQFHLRAGMNQAEVYTDAVDIYGSGVNLAARVAGLAQPGETMITAGVRDSLNEGLDPPMEDVGECYLKHVAEPVRIWRVGRKSEMPEGASLLAPAKPAATPTLAVLPFQSRSNEPEALAIGELIADAVIALLSRSEHLRVISRLSTSQLRGRIQGATQAARHLQADFVLSGSYVLTGTAREGKLLVSSELVDARTMHTSWTDRIEAEVGDLLRAESETAHVIARWSSMAILNSEAQKARTQPVATLSAYTLQISAITLIHRSDVADFEKGHDLLAALSERHPRAAEVHAWIAKWHVLRVIRGLSADTRRDTGYALDACRRALDHDPTHPLALAVKGYTLCLLTGEGEEARTLIDAAISTSPSDLHAWLYRSVWSSMYGTGADAVAEALRARSLSPLDPHGYFIETILASAYTMDGQYAQAIESARHAFHLDCFHAPALRTLLVAQVESGQLDSAQLTLQKLLGLQPDLSIARYRAMGSTESATRQRMIAALKALGLPDQTH